LLLLPLQPLLLLVWCCLASPAQVCCWARKLAGPAGGGLLAGQQQHWALQEAAKLAVGLALLSQGHSHLAAQAACWQHCCVLPLTLPAAAGSSQAAAHLAAAAGCLLLLLPLQQLRQRTPLAGRLLLLLLKDAPEAAVLHQTAADGDAGAVLASACQPLLLLLLASLLLLLPAAAACWLMYRQAELLVAQQCLPPSCVAMRCRCLYQLLLLLHPVGKALAAALVLGRAAQSRACCLLPCCCRCHCCQLQQGLLAAGCVLIAAQVLSAAAAAGPAAACLQPQAGCWQQLQLRGAAQIQVPCLQHTSAEAVRRFEETWM
jgi:hypothetical protein